MAVLLFSCFKSLSISTIADKTNAAAAYITTTSINNIITTTTTCSNNTIAAAAATAFAAAVVVSIVARQSEEAMVNCAWPLMEMLLPLAQHKRHLTCQR